MATTWLLTGTDVIGIDTLAWSWNPGLEVGLPAATALAAVALIGYLFGQRTEHAKQAARNVKRQQELERASSIAHQLETIADSLRQDLAKHHGRLTQFRRRLSDAQAVHDERAWKELCSEAEQMLSPTMQLAERLSSAYDAIRRQSDALETFSQARTDPQTGVGNGRALEEKLGVLLGAARHGGTTFSIALVSIDRDTVDAVGDGQAGCNPQYLELARLIQTHMRDSDFVARYGDDEFVVVMPQTKLAAACLFGERLQKAVVERMKASVSCGITEHQVGDDAKSLLARADSAFYSARAAGGNRLFVHAGARIREHRTNGSPRASEPGSPATVEPGILPFDSVALSVLATTEAAGQ